MKLRFLRTVVILGLITILLSTLSGCTFTLNSYAFLPDCSGVTFTYSNARATVHNYTWPPPFNVIPAEQVLIYAFDGDGNVMLRRFTTPVNVGYYDAGDTVTYRWVTPPQANPLTVQLINQAGGSLASDQLIFEMTGTCSTLPWAGTFPTSYKDGRINRFDTLPPIVVYPVDYGNGVMGMHLYTVDENSNGVFYMEITPEVIAAAGTGDWVHVITSPDGLVSVHRMGERWHMTATFEGGKIYVLTFDTIDSQTPVESYIIDPPH